MQRRGVAIEVEKEGEKEQGVTANGAAPSAAPSFAASTAYSNNTNNNSKRPQSAMAAIPSPKAGNSTSCKKKDRAFLESIQFQSNARSKPAGNSDSNAPPSQGWAPRPPVPKAPPGAIRKPRPTSSGPITKRDMLIQARDARYNNNTNNNGALTLQQYQGGGGGGGWCGSPGGPYHNPEYEKQRNLGKLPLKNAMARPDGYVLPEAVINALNLPSQTIPQELQEYLFASTEESDAKCSKFCRHGRHLAHCSDMVCVDSHEKFQWLNLVRHKAKVAFELLVDADRQWRQRLAESLEREVRKRRAEQRAEVFI